MGVQKKSREALEQVKLPSGALLWGVVGTAAIVAYIVAEQPGAEVLRWFALLPLMAGVLWTLRADAFSAAELPTASPSAEALARLRQTQQKLGAAECSAVLEAAVQVLPDELGFDRALVLQNDPDGERLLFGALSHMPPDPDDRLMLEQLEYTLEDCADDPFLGAWCAGQSVNVEDASFCHQTRLAWLCETLKLRRFLSVPLTVGSRLTGVILVDNSLIGKPIPPHKQKQLEALAPYVALLLENARLYQRTDDQLSARVQELEIISRISRELSYTLSVERVLEVTLDWALRFTGADAAAVAMVETETNTFRIIAGYGYPPERWEQLRRQPWPLSQGVGGRVARTGEAALISDVRQDPDFVEILPNTRTLLSVPLVRADRVIAVLTLESTREAAFDEANLAFVSRLAALAAAAVDNANLYDQTVRERHKLELILSNITNAVIVVGPQGQLVLVNQAALHTFHLLPKEEHVGRPFAEVFAYSPLRKLFERAQQSQRALAEELPLSDGRTLYVNIVPSAEVGWIIVTHDITPFKETEQLKNELVATASHDLKNPLGSIMGYVDLIEMTHELTPQGEEYVQRVRNAVNHMLNLIDDLLDLARIESGIRLRYGRVNLNRLFQEVAGRFEVQLQEKAMTLEFQVAPDVPLLAADPRRMAQIITNLVSNAIKYTPPEGHVWLSAALHGDKVQIVVKDDGLGISPEDQAQIFTRFYRVRTPETESIEGTGLGLAIVKSLVELHGGQISVESRLGEGSTFYVTLPLQPPADVEWLEGEGP